MLNSISTFPALFVDCIRLVIHFETVIKYFKFTQDKPKYSKKQAKLAASPAPYKQALGTWLRPQDPRTMWKTTECLFLRTKHQ